MSASKKRIRDDLNGDDNNVGASIERNEAYSSSDELDENENIVLSQRTSKRLAAKRKKLKCVSFNLSCPQVICEMLQEKPLQEEMNSKTFVTTSSAPLLSSSISSRRISWRKSLNETKMSESSGCEDNLKEIAKLLKSVETTQNNTLQGEAFELPIIIGLELDNFGPVSFPLTDSDGFKVMQFCQRSRPDTSDMNTLEIDPSKVKIVNPDWEQRIGQLSNRVAIELGYKGEIKIKLEKVLLSRKWGSYKFATSENKTDKLFGTMIVQPASMHTGGELVFREKATSQSAPNLIDFGEKEGMSRFTVNFAANYSLFDFELLEIKSGYRLLLVYSLYEANENGVFGDFFKDQIVEKLFQTIQNLGENNYQLGILLDNNYAWKFFEENGAKALKGVDRNRFDALTRVNSLLPVKNQLVFHLTCLYMDIRMQNDEEIDRIVSTPQLYNIQNETVREPENFTLDTFTKIYDLSETSTTEFDRENKNAWRLLMSLTSTSSETTTSLTYGKSLLLVWSRSSELSNRLKFEFNTAVESVLRPSEILEGQRLDDEQLSRDIVTIVEHIAASRGRVKLQESHLNEMLVVIRRLGRIELVETVLEGVELNKRISLELARLVVQYGNDLVGSVVLEKMRPYAQNMIYIWIFIAHLYSKNEKELACEYFENIVLPIFQYSNHLIFFLERYVENGFVFLSEFGTQKKSFESVIEFLELFPEYTDETIGQLTAGVVQLIGEKDAFKNIVKELDKHRGLLGKYPVLWDIVEARRDWLETIVNDKPLYTWSMPSAVLPAYPRIERFLRSGEREINFKFDSFDEMRRFICLHNDSADWSDANGFSIEVTVIGERCVSIVKTRKLYDKQYRIYHSYVLEMDAIKKMLKT